MSDPKDTRLSKRQIGTAMARGAHSRGNAYLDPRSTPPEGVPYVKKQQNEMTAGAAGVMGSQQPLGSEAEKLKETIRQLVREIIRKKPGGGGYALYSPNQGKKKPPKKVGEFPTRIAAKRAELARFPPKDTEQLKKARKRIDNLTKDPKKRADAERRELIGKSAPKPPAQKKKPAPKKESIVDAMARAINEALFHDEGVPGSPWDERLAALHPDAVSSDKKLAALHKAMESGTIAALGHAHKGLAKALKGVAKVIPGDMGRDEEGGKRFMPVTLDVGGEEIGPVHLYVDGGNVRIEMAPEARGAIQKLEPKLAKDLRGGLMSFQEDGLPGIDHARKPWSARDSYMDGLHDKIDRQLGKMSPLELHLARRLMNTKHRGRR